MKRRDSESVLYFSLSVLWFLYLAIRAWKVPPVYDEVTTFFLYILPGEFLPFYSYPSANNHWLYSLGTWIFYQWLPSSLFSLRILSLLSFPLYARAVFLLGKRLGQRRARWMLWALLLGLHFPLEFFAYARGYAWGLTAMVWALYFAHDYLSSAKRNSLIGFLLSLVLGVSFNLNLIPLLGLALVWVFWVRPKDSLKNIILVVAFAVLPLLFYIRYSWFLKTQGELYYGVKGFWTHSTLPTLSEALFSSASTGAHWLFSIWILVALATLLLGLRKQRIKAPSFEVFGFFGTWIGLTILFFVWDVNLPQDRTALFIFFLLIISDAFSIDSLKRGFLNTLLSLSTGLLAVTLFFQFSTEASSFTLWKKEQVPRAFLKRISEDSMRSPSVSAHYLTAHSYALQRHLYYPESPPIIGLRDTAYSTDFVIRETSRTSRFFRKNYSLVANDIPTQKALWRLRAHEWEIMETDTVKEPEIATEFLPIHTLEADSTRPGWHKLIVRYSWEYHSKQPIYFAIQKTGKQGVQIFESIPIFPTKGNKQESTLSYPFLMDSTHTNIKFFFHNPARATLSQTRYDWELYNHPQ